MNCELDGGPPSECGRDPHCGCRFREEQARTENHMDEYRSGLDAVDAPDEE